MLCSSCEWEEWGRNIRETALQMLRSVKKEVEETLQVLNEEVLPAAHGEDHGGAGCPPAARGGPCRSRFPHGSWWRTPPWSRWIRPEGRCNLWRGHAVAGSWQELQPVEKCSGRSRFSGKNCNLCGSHAGAVFSWVTIPCGKGPILEQFLKNCSPWKGPLHGGKDHTWRTVSHGRTPRWGRVKVWGGKSGRNEVLWTD